MLTYFPQINSNFIMTQLPYSFAPAYETVAVDMESGMRWSFSRRGNLGLIGFLSGPSVRFGLNFPSITDDEVGALLSFFRTCKGRYHSFRLLDPGGNLLQYSEDFSKAYWDKSAGVSIAGPAADPFGGNLATRLIGSSYSSQLTAIVGPSDGGLNGFVVNCSAWLMAEHEGQSVAIGFVDHSFSRIDSAVFALSSSNWRRVSFTTTLWDDDYFRVILGGPGAWVGSMVFVYGMQVTPMKGEGAYVRSPAGYGYHPNCRFDTDGFVRQALGPNQNSLVLPCVEFSP